MEVKRKRTKTNTASFLAIFSNAIHSFVEQGAPVSTIIDLIKQTPLEVIILSAEQNSQLLNFCYHEELVDHWDTVLQNTTELANKLNTTLDYHALLPQRLVHSFDLIRGLYYFDQSITHADDQCLTFDSQQLLLAEQYGYFHAINRLNGSDMDSLTQAIKAKTASDIDIQQVLARMTRLAALYGTPGYIELSRTYVQLAYYHGHVFEDDDATAMSYSRAIMYLETARLLEPDSGAEINNAYFAKTLAQCGIYQHSSFAGAMKELESHAALYLEYDEICEANRQATSETSRWGQSSLTSSYQTLDCITPTI